MIKKKTSKKKKSGEVFEVRVTMIIHKSYYVEAKDGEEAIQDRKSTRLNSSH